MKSYHYYQFIKKAFSLKKGFSNYSFNVLSCFAVAAANYHKLDYFSANSFLLFGTIGPYLKPVIASQLKVADYPFTKAASGALLNSAGSKGVCCPFVSVADGVVNFFKTYLYRARVYAHFITMFSGMPSTDEETYATEVRRKLHQFNNRKFIGPYCTFRPR